MSVKKIKRIDALQAGKVTAVLSAMLMLIIFVPFMLLFSAIGLGSGSMRGFGAMFGGGFLMIIFLPVFYGIIGFVAGLLYAAVYNFTYRFHGGVQIEYEDLDDEINRIGNQPY